MRKERGKELTWKVPRRVLLALISVMMISALAGVEVAAQQIKLYAVVTTDPYFGFSGGYHDVLYTIRDDFEKTGIGFELVVDNKYDSVWDICWDDYWNVSTAYGALPPFAWDLTTAEWSLIPTGLLWVDEIVYSFYTPPDGGYNCMPWLNALADKLYRAGTQTLDPSVRRTNLLKWQEVFMHDPPVINMFYCQMYECTAAYVEGWEPTVWYYDVSHFGINKTKFNEVVPVGSTRWNIGNDTLLYAIGAPIWGFNPLFTLTYSEEMMRALTHDNLYVCTKTWNDTERDYVRGPEGFYTRPELAAGPIKWLTGPNGPNTRARIPLRQGVLWSDGVPFNATDVKFTYDLVIYRPTKCWAYCDYKHIIQSVEIVNATCVDLILYTPYYDLENVLSSDWGVQILPWHQLKDVDPTALNGHISNTNPYYLVGTGPYLVESYTSGVEIVFKRNPLHFGYSLGWGPHVSKIILKWIPDAATRLLSLQNFGVDFGEYPLAPVKTWQDMATKEPWIRTHKVWTYLYHGTHPLWMNLDNPYLSNRYVRQALAHSINYTAISNVLLGWGVPEAYPGVGTFIIPHLTDIYNTALVPYEYNITKATQYLAMWYYSRTDTDWTKGPAGDADFSGLVELDDFYLWVKYFGKYMKDINMYDEFKPGNDIDPDFDNNGYIEMPDFYKWTAAWGKYYPFKGAR